MSGDQGTETLELTEEVQRLQSILNEIKDVVGWFDADYESPIAFRNELWALVG